MPRRRKMTRKASRKNFKKGYSRTPRINFSGPRVMRGGFRI